MVEERPGVRFTFDEWTGGELRFSPSNRIVPNRPITLEVKWTKEFFLGLEGPEGVRLVGSGWHGDRQAVVLKAPATVDGPSEDVRQRFVRWNPVSNPALVIPSDSQAITRIVMDDAHVIRAEYLTEYQVVVQNPLGTINQAWIAKGEELTLDTPPTIDIVADQERFNFTGWEGADFDSPKGFVVVNGPLKAIALYDREFMVKVEASYGASGEGWYTEGETAIIKVPENPSSILFLKKVFNGYHGYPGAGSTLPVPVTAPVSISTAYRTNVEAKGLSIAVGALVAVGVIYLVSQRVYGRMAETRRRYTPPRRRN